MAAATLYKPDLETIDDLKNWVRAILQRYSFDVRGILLRDRTVLPVPSESSVRLRESSGRSAALLLP
jgi:hypothetical protein